ncbi:TPA: GntR family transcriptional regulator [Photobacterium damselae]|uniref:GntR family transcriptional regulator n=1 Tax=Photobacterium damselae TaxID=38293 RepID=UPI0025435171
MEKDNFLTISDSVMSQIRHDILCGKFESGQKLLLNQLKELYHVGGTPLREALIQLSWQNYIIMKPQKGFSVAETSLDELKGILKTRIILEQEALKSAMLNGDDSWEFNVLSSYHQLRKLKLNSSNFDYDEWEIKHKTFHLSLIEYQHPDFLVQTISQIYDQQERYRHFILNSEFTQGDQYHDCNEHENLLNSVLNRDVEKACTLLRKHTERLYDLIKHTPLLKV